MLHDTGYGLQQLLNALQLACFYVPLATAFALIQAITGRIFLSFGDMAMVTSFAAIYACFDAMLHGSTDWEAALASLLLAIATGAGLGAAIAKLMATTRLSARPQSFMIASVGLSIALQEAMRLQSGSRDIWVPPLFQGERVVLAEGAFPAQLSLMSVIAMAVAVTVMTVFAGLMRYSRLGRNWRACTQSLSLARLCGIDTARVVVWTFIGATGLAAVSGWMSAISYGGTNFSIGLMLGFKAMFASVIGGFGTISGAMAGAIALAFIEVIWSGLFSTTYRDVAVFTVIVIVLVIRPEGILGVASRRESEALS